MILVPVQVTANDYGQLAATPLARERLYGTSDAGAMALNDRDGRDLKALVSEFIRRVGLLNQERTPCGRPLPTSQAHSLQVLGQEGPVSQRTLAAHLHLDESTVSRLAEQLVERAWAEKRVNAGNRREMLLTLTERGQAMLDDVTAASEQKFTSIWARIPADQRAQVLVALDTLIAAVSET